MRQIMNQKDHYLQEKLKIVIGIMKDELGGNVIVELAVLKPKTCCIAI